MKWYFWVIVFFVAMTAGYFAYPAINPVDVIPAPTGVTVISHGPVKPDTVLIDHYVEKEVPIYVTKWKDKEIFIDQIIIDTVYVTKEVPVYRSLEFFQEPYYTSEVYAWALAPVDSFYNRVTIDYEQYFNDVYAERVKAETAKNRWNYVLIGGGVGIGIAAIAFTLIR